MAGQRGTASLAAALASGQSVKDAARTAGLGERTAYRRVADPAFRQAVSQARADLLARAVGVLADGATEAAETLRALLKADSDSVRARAAVALLDAAMKGVELSDLAERLAALEAQADAGIFDPPKGHHRWSA
jgi:hypothetical protein